MVRIAAIVLILDMGMPKALLADVVLEAGEIDSSKVEVGAYAEVLYKKEKKLSTASGYIKAVDAEGLTIGQGFGKQIAFEHIQKLILAESDREMDKLKKTTDTLSVRKENRPGRIVVKLLGSVFTGCAGILLGGAVGGRFIENGCPPGELCIDEEVALGALVGYLVGVPIGMHKIDLHDQFINSFAGSVIGGAASLVVFALEEETMEDLWPAFVISPLVGATIMSELTRKPPEDSRFSIGLLPTSNGSVSAVATLRF